MSKERTVIYVSNCAADAQGNPDPFMAQELPWLRRHFQRVLVVGYYGVADVTQEQLGPIPATVPAGAVWRAGLPAVWKEEFWRALGHLRRDRRLSPLSAGKLLLFALRGLKLHLWTESLLAGREEGQTTLYAYWMSYDAYGAALSKARHPGLRFIVRGHAFDIDPQRNPMNPYLMKDFIARQAEGLYFISRRAKEQYLSYGGAFTPLDKVRVAAIGSGGEPIGEEGLPSLPAQEGEETVFQLVSCSTVVEIKQLPLLVDALTAWEGPRLHWVHLGGGPGEARLRAYAASRLGDKAGVSYEITGRLTPAQVEENYRSRAFDAFVNTSRMEGVPVSIMEAMRVGIPIIAPRVGGIPELVQERFGLLYEPGQGADGAREALARFAALPREHRLAMGKAAKESWAASWRSEALLPLLFPEEAAQAQEG